MVFAPYSRMEAETDMLLDSVPQLVDTSNITTNRDRSQSSPPPPPPSFRPTNRNRATSDPFFPQYVTWHPILESEEDIDDDEQDLLSRTKPALSHKKRSFGSFKQGVLKAVGFKR